MKQMIAAASLTIAISTTSTLAGNLSDPILEQELIIQEAENDAGKQDALMVTLLLAAVFAAAGGAF